MTLVTYGLMTRYSLEAADVVQGDGGISVEVIDLRTVSPWDKERVLESVRKTGQALIVYEANLSGGFGVFKRAPFERLFRDVRLGRFHPANAALTVELAAKTALGIDPDETPRWG